MEQDERCAPGKNFKNGSCFTVDNLYKITQAYNSNFKDKITLKKDKKFLLKELTDKLKNVCDNQQCWLKLKFMKDLNDQDLLKETFRPKGPDTGTKWLSTSDIDKVMNQYQMKFDNFVFLGAVPLDFETIGMGFEDLPFNKMIKDGRNKLGMVINLDTHDKDGSHWVGLFSDLVKKQIYFFDSYGHQPEKEIKKFMDKIAKWMNKAYNLKNDSEGELMNIKNIDIKYNSYRHQYKHSECGVYSMNFIIRLLNGEGFAEIAKSKVIDNEINKCRSVYFSKK